MIRFPASWRRIRAKYVYRVVDERAGSVVLPLLAVSIHHGVVPRDTLTEDEPRADDLSNYKRCLAGDVVLNRMRAFQGAVGIAPQAGIVSPDYLVLRLVDGVDGRFFHHLFRSSWFVGEMAGRLRGIGSSDQGNVRTPRINVQDFGEITLALPSLNEQHAIASSLDDETARIDALIEKRQRVIALLGESWRSQLQQAFSSSSGLRLKHVLAAPLAYGVLVPEHDPEGVPMLRITDLRGGAVDLDSVARIPLDQSREYRRTIVQGGDLVVSVVGTLGRSIEIERELVGANLNRALARVQLQPDVPRNLIRLFFMSDLFAQQAALATSGDSAQPTLGLADMKNFIVRLPRDRGGWASLALDLERREARLARLHRVLARQIDLLGERRQALIARAVTGELEVARAEA